jgi:hypothetical protein
LVYVFYLRFARWLGYACREGERPTYRERQTEVEGEESGESDRERE